MSLNQFSDIPQQLIETIAKGDAIAVIGSGTSLSCGMPSWEGLLNDLITECKKQIPEFEHAEELYEILSTKGYLDVAETCQQYLTGSLYRDFIQKKFRISPSKKSPLLKTIISIPFAAIITTNYDTLIEKELERSNTHPHGSPVYTHRNISQLAQLNGHKDFYIFKAHGHIDDIESIILSRSDYQACGDQVDSAGSDLVAYGI